MTVTVKHGNFSSRVVSPSRAVTRLIRAAVPAAGREYDAATCDWIVFASRVDALIAGLRASGVEVVETSTRGAV